MTLKQLEYFAAVAETGSITAAARDLHVAQPPVSRQLAQLEDELEVQLFRRNNKGIELTEAGKCLRQQIQQTFQDLRSVARRVRDLDAGLRGQLSIGVVYSDVPIVLELLKEYHARYPQVELFIRLGSPVDLLSDLDRGRLHVLFLRSRKDRISGFRERILGEDPLELVMRAETDPAPGLNTVPIQALRGAPMCLLRGDDLWGYSDRLTAACQREGFSLNIVCQCYDTPMAMQLVQAGFGIGFLPRSIVEVHADKSVYTKPVQGVDALSYPTLVWNSDLYSSGCVKNFLELAGQSKC